jgi:hypothetical protein
MEARITAEMLDALKQTLEIPDNLAAAADAAVAHEDQFLLRLTEDEAMAMVEMCQWYIKKDPDTGELTPKAKLFNAIVDAIDEADLN